MENAFTRAIQELRAAISYAGIGSGLGGCEVTIDFKEPFAREKFKQWIIYHSHPLSAVPDTRHLLLPEPTVFYGIGVKITGTPR